MNRGERGLPPHLSSKSVSAAPCDDPDNHSPCPKTKNVLCSAIIQGQSICKCPPDDASRGPGHSALQNYCRHEIDLIQMAGIGLLTLPTSRHPMPAPSYFALSVSSIRLLTSAPRQANSSTFWRSRCDQAPCSHPSSRHPGSDS